MKKLIVLSLIAIGTIAVSIDIEARQENERFQLDEGVHYCKPSLPCWPTKKEWQELNKAVHHNLLKPKPVNEACKDSPYKDACKKNDPFFLQSIPGGTQSTGMLNAWEQAISPYAVAPENAQQVATAVDFARKHKLKIAIKGTGHDYLGRSNAPDSLLIWTHKMRDIHIDDHFICQGCGHDEDVPAVTVGAGVRWLEAYGAVVTKHGRYVQGGGCTSVGVAGGFSQGGGYGAFSKMFGSAASNILEVEIITADGKIRVANKYQNPDLFWALKGGGAGTFGVVSKMTMRTHDLPSHFGRVEGSITAKNKQDFKKLLRKFIHFFRDSLDNKHFGEKIKIKKDSLGFEMSTIGLASKELKSIWSPFLRWAKAQEELTVDVKISFIKKGAIRGAWNADYMLSKRKGVLVKNQKDYWWWADDNPEVSSFIGTYQSRYLPLHLFSKEEAKKTAQMLYDAAQHSTINLYTNKALSGISSDAKPRQKETSMHPKALDSAVLFISRVIKNDPVNNVKNESNTLADLARKKKGIDESMKIIYDATPDAGSYANEADYFQKDWQHEFWGTNYPKLLEIKQKYDSENVFSCHHCVGSEFLEE